MNKHFYYHDFGIGWRVMRHDYRTIEIEDQVLNTHEDIIIHEFVCNERVAERLAYNRNITA